MRIIVLLPILLLLTSVAFAQTTTGTQINAQDVYTAVLQPVLMALASAAAIVITALAGMVVNWLRKQTGIQGLQIDQQHRDALQTSITNAAGLALNSLGNSLDGKKVDVRNPVVQEAVAYVIKTAPDALAHFNLTGRADEIAQKIVANIPQVANTTTTK